MLVAAGAWLRLWTIGDGLPYVIGVDEPEIVDRALAILRTGDFNPHFFHYPALPIYLHTVVAAARFLAGSSAAEMFAIADVWNGDVMLWSRLFTAALSTWTIWLVYRAGLRWGAAVALIAAAAMAVHPQLVREAQYALTDTPLTAFVALTIVASLRAREDTRVRWLVAAGAAVGLAAASKYTGILALVMPLAVAWRVPPGGLRGARLATVAAAAAGAFVMTAPYTLFDPPGFLAGMSNLLQSYNRPVTYVPIEVYVKHIQDWYAWPGAVPRWASWPALGLMSVGVIGAAAGLRARETRAASAVLLLFPLVFLWFLASQTLVYARYAMPIVPALSLLLALGIARTAGALGASAQAPGRTALVAGLFGLLLIAPVGTLVSTKRDRARVGTTELLAEWVVARVKPGETVAMESRLATFPPKRFSIENMLRLTDVPLDKHQARGTTYLIAVSMEYDKYFNDPRRYPREVAAYNEIFRAAELVHTISPSADHPGPTFRVMRLSR